MKHLEKTAPITEQSEFNKKFHDKNKSFSISYDMMGNILSIETDDKEILEHVSKLGLK